MARATGRRKAAGDPSPPAVRPRITVTSPEPGVEYQIIELTRTHTLNTTTYSPGRHRVRRDIARVLLENEQRMARQVARLFRPRAGVISGTRLIEVAPDYFDDPGVWNKLPALRSDGRIT